MAPKTVKVVIADALADLSPDDLERFRLHLLERRGPPQVRRNQVDKKTYLELSDLLVNTFTQQKSIEVTLELLRDIGCNSVAEDLASTSTTSTISRKRKCNENGPTPANKKGPTSAKKGPAPAKKKGPTSAKKGPALAKKKGPTPAKKGPALAKKKGPTSAKKGPAPAKKKGPTPAKKSRKA